MLFRFIFSAVIGYLLGSIPFGLIVGRAVGVDVRAVGSGKTGATNVQRSAGWGPGLLVAVGDALKGAIPVLLAQHVYASPAAFRSLGATATHAATLSAIAGAAAGLAAIIGHNYPLYVGFKGGRGVATTGGMALALALPSALIALPIFIAIVALTRYVSLGSMVGALAMAFIALLFIWSGHGDLVSGFAGFATLLIAAIAIIVSHNDNIQRLRSGTERKIGEKAQPAPRASAAR